MQIIAKMETAEVSSILTSEVESALSQMKGSKAPGKDHIVVEMIKSGGRDSSEEDTGDVQCSRKSRQYLRSGQMPSSH